jgi:hypothetical protein
MFCGFEVCLHSELVYNICKELYEILCSEQVYECCRRGEFAFKDNLILNVASDGERNADGGHNNF